MIKACINGITNLALASSWQPIKLHIRKISRLMIGTCIYNVTSIWVFHLTK